MALELIYTSAPAGVKPGTRGFCTVACSRELPGPLAMTLESLSGYRHLFAPNSENARLNPVVRSHLIFKFNGSPVHLLSRIADAGYDYSQRTNKIAHYLVLRSNERPSAGPAELFTRPNLFVEQWNGEPTVFAHDKAIPKFDAAPEVCSAWQRLTGDAGWGGILAAAAIRRQPVGLIFKVGQDVFPLYREAIALLPTETRWQATFSTFYSKMPPGFECLWRTVLLDSPEEPQVRAVSNSIFLDLTRPLGNADSFVRDSETARWVEAARTGTHPQSAQAATKSIFATNQQSAAPFEELSLGPDDEELSIDDMLGNASTRTGASPFAGDASEFGGGSPSGGSPFAPQIILRRKKSKTRFILPLLFILALIGAVGAAGYYCFSGPEKNKKADNNTEVVKTTTEKSTEKSEETANANGEAAKESPAEKNQSDGMNEKNDVKDKKTKEDLKAEPEADQKDAEEVAKAAADRKAKEEKKEEEEKLAADKQICQNFLDEAAKLCLSFSEGTDYYKNYSEKRNHVERTEFASFVVNKLKEPCKETIELCPKRNWRIQVKLEPFFRLSKFTYNAIDKIIGESSTENNEKYRFIQFNCNWLIDGASDGDAKGLYTFLTIDLNTDTGISIYHHYDKQQGWNDYLNQANLCLLSTLSWLIVDEKDNVIVEAHGQAFEPFNDYPPLTFSAEENSIFNEKDNKKGKKILFGRLIPEPERLFNGETDQFYFSLELYQRESNKTIGVVSKKPQDGNASYNVTVAGDIISPLTFEANLSVVNNRLSLTTNANLTTNAKDDEVKNNNILNEEQKNQLVKFSVSTGYRILLKHQDRPDACIVVVDVPPQPSPQVTSDNKE